MNFTHYIIGTNYNTMSAINEIKECEYCGGDCYKTGEWVCDEFIKDQAEEEELKKNPCYEHYQNGQYYCELCKPPERKCINAFNDNYDDCMGIARDFCETCENCAPKKVVKRVVKKKIVEPESEDDEYDICEICYKHIYGHNALQDFDRCDGVYFCSYDCLAVSKLKKVDCEGCGEKYREDKLTNERCHVCHLNYLNFLEYLKTV